MNRICAHCPNCLSKGSTHPLSKPTKACCKGTSSPPASARPRQLLPNQSRSAATSCQKSFSIPCRSSDDKWDGLHKHTPHLLFVPALFCCIARGFYTVVLFVLIKQIACSTFRWQWRLRTQPHLARERKTDQQQCCS